MKLLFLLLSIYYCHASDSWVCSANTDSFVSSSKHAETENRLRALEVQVQQLQKLVQQHSPTFSTIDGIPRDCEEIYDNSTRKDGIYSISPDGRCPFFVYCDIKHGGWTIIQKRVDDHVNFYQNWNNYISGFGHMDGSHWLGRENPPSDPRWQLNVLK